MIGMIQTMTPTFADASEPRLFGFGGSHCSAVSFSWSAPYRGDMRGFRYGTLGLLSVAFCAACYRLPLRIRTNDATGYEDVGIPLIEAVEYTPSGRDIRVLLEAPGYVTVIVVDPDRGATVRFRRGELQSRFAEKGLHRYPLDRISSPMTLSQVIEANGGSRALRGLGRPRQLAAPLRTSVFDPAPIDPALMASDTTRKELSLESRRVAAGFGPVSAVHVVVLVTEMPLDLVGVAMRLARGSLDPALVAQSAADVVQGGRWMAAVARLRGQ